MESLKEGDKIYCYLIETQSRYECVELKSDIMILSLDQYNQIYSKQGILGLIIMPIGFLICFVFSIKFFHAYHSERKANKENKDIYTSLFLSMLLSIINLSDAINTLLGASFFWDAAFMQLILFALMGLTLAANKLKITLPMILILGFFAAAASLTTLQDFQATYFIYSYGRSFLERPIPKFLIYSFSGLIGALYLDDKEVFFKIFEKFSFATILLSLVLYILNVNEKVNLQYMTFSYNMLLHVTFLGILCLYKFNWLRFLTFATGFVLIFLGGCRGALVSLLACLLFYILVVPFGSSLKKAGLLIFTIILILVIVFNFASIVEWLNKTLTGTEINSRTLMKLNDGDFLLDSGRSTIQQKLFDNFSWLGHGIFSDRILTGTYAHNLFIELIYQFGGMLGGLLSCAICIIILAALSKSSPIERAILCALLSTGFVKLMLSGSYLNQEPGFYVLIGYCINLLSGGKKHEKLDQTNSVHSKKQGKTYPAW